MVEVLLRRRVTAHGYILAPADGLAEHEMERMPLGRDIRCTLVLPRSGAHNRLYFACLTRVAENLDQAISKDTLHEWVKLKLGYAKPVSLRSGAVEWVPDSTAYDKMDQAEFNAFSKRAFDLIKDAFGIDPEDIKREGAELLGGSSDESGGEAGADGVGLTSPSHGGRT